MPFAMLKSCLITSQLVLLSPNIGRVLFCPMNGRLRPAFKYNKYQNRYPLHVAMHALSLAPAFTTKQREAVTPEE